jgi:cytochrome P450
VAGEELQALWSEEARADPYPIYERLRGFGPVVAADNELVVVLGYAECDAALRDPRLLVEDAQYRDRVWPQWREHRSARLLSLSMLETNPPHHERMRRLVGGAFTPRRMAGLREAVRANAERYADWLAGADGPVDFMAEFGYPLPITMICELLGIPPADRGWFRPRAACVTDLLDMSGSDLVAADQAGAELAEYFEELVRERRRQPADDLVSALAAAHDRNPAELSAPELLGNLVLLLIAGFETTTNLLGNGLYALLRRPEALAALRADPERVGGYVEEMLRFDPPVQLTSRVAAVDLDIAGVPLPRGGSVLLLIGAANRDPRRFADPARFWPDRPGNQPLSFGAGAHFCLGQALARLEGQVAFPVLLARFPELALAGTPERRPGLTLRGFRSLPVSAAYVD